jgi:hypothetical protein
MSRLEAKKKDHPAKVQQRNVRSFQPAPPGPVLARASAIGARRMAKNPKTRRPSLSRESICEPLRRKIKVDPPQLHIATLQQFRQLGNIRRDPSRLVAREQLGPRTDSVSHADAVDLPCFWQAVAARLPCSGLMLKKTGDVSWIQSLFYSCLLSASLPGMASASGSLVSAAAMVIQDKPGGEVPSGL